MKINLNSTFKKKEIKETESKEDILRLLERFNNELIKSVKPKKLKSVLAKPGWAKIEKKDKDGSYSFGWNRLFVKSPCKISILDICPKCKAKVKGQIIQLNFHRSQYIPKYWCGSGDSGYVALCKKCLFPVGFSSKMEWRS